MTESKNDSIPKSKAKLYLIWGVSLVVVVYCSLWLLLDPTLSTAKKVTYMILLQLGGSIFFPLTVGNIIEWIRDKKNATILWDFISDCGEAGIVKLYSRRDKSAAIKDLERAFEQHEKGDILLTGPSLRLFFASAGGFYAIIRRNIDRYRRLGVKIYAVNADINSNMSLPIRTFVEEFNPDGSYPSPGEGKDKVWQRESSDWARAHHDLSLKEFHDDFYTKYGVDAGGEVRCRCVDDLQGVSTGIDQLNVKKIVVSSRTTISAPYFTAVIFPDKCYYTPNILNSTVPANMPMLVFSRSGPVYRKLLEHFKFIWWSGAERNAKTKKEN